MRSTKKRDKEGGLCRGERNELKGRKLEFLAG